MCTTCNGHCIKVVVSRLGTDVHDVYQAFLTALLPRNLFDPFCVDTDLARESLPDRDKGGVRRNPPDYD